MRKPGEKLDMKKLSKTCKKLKELEKQYYTANVDWNLVIKNNLITIRFWQTISIILFIILIFVV